MRADWILQVEQVPRGSSTNLNRNSGRPQTSRAADDAPSFGPAGQRDEAITKHTNKAREAVVGKVGGMGKNKEESTRMRGGREHQPHLDPQP